MDNYIGIDVSKSTVQVYIFLLNAEVYKDEESEIMDLSSRHPGVFRYKNFYDFLDFFCKESIGTMNAWN